MRRDLREGRRRVGIESCTSAGADARSRVGRMPSRPDLRQPFAAVSSSAVDRAARVNHRAVRIMRFRRHVGMALLKARRHEGEAPATWGIGR